MDRLKLLVAEDSEFDLFLFKRALQRAGIACDAYFVSDGQEAMDYFRGLDQFADRQIYPLPDVLLLDINMPRLSGFDVLKWLKAQPSLSSTPVIIFSSSQDNRDVSRAYSLGANSYMSKVTEPQRLAEMVETFEHYWLEFNLLPYLER